MPSMTYSLDFNGYWAASNTGRLPDDSGIYCAYACVYNRSQKRMTINRLLYIGESDNIRSRVASHEATAEWRRQLYAGQELCFNAAVVSAAMGRKRAEAALIHRHGPPCNTEYVDYFPFDTTTIRTSGKNIALDSFFTL